MVYPRQKLDIPKEKTGITISKFANSSAATIPIAFDYFRDSEKIQTGNKVLLTAAAAGLTSGAVLFEV